MTSISLAIVTYNNEETIGGTLHSLVNNWPEDVKLSCFLIDNNSTDETMQKVFPYLNRLKVIVSEQGNIGFGAAHNLILDQLDSDYHIIMNPDVSIQNADSYNKIASYMSEHPDIGMIVPKIIDECGELQYLCRRDLTVLDLALRFFPVQLMKKRQEWHEMRDMDYTSAFDVHIASGSFMVIRTELFKKLQGFDRAFFLYAEDADLSKRVNSTARVVYFPEITVCHKWERASYKNWKMTRLHLKSLWQYFRKWGFTFR